MKTKKTKTMKNLILFFTFLFYSSLAFSQVNYQSDDNNFNFWDDASNWNVSEQWADPKPTYNVGGSTDTVFVNGETNATNDDLTIGGDAVLYVNDTLAVYKNLNISQGSRLVVKGVLIVLGNLNSDGGTVSNNDGEIVVGNNLNLSDGADFNNNNSLYTDSISKSGGSNFNGNDSKNLSELSGSLKKYYEEVSGSKLPVTWLKVGYNNNHYIEWTVSQEINNDYYIVQRKDGDEWINVEKVDGAGTINYIKEYELRVYVEGYYRIKQVDFDNEYSYSKIFFADIEKQNKVIKIYDMMGREVKKSQRVLGKVYILIYSNGNKEKVIYTK